MTFKCCQLRGVGCLRRAKLEGVILSAVLAEKLYVGDLQGIVSAL